MSAGPFRIYYHASGAAFQADAAFHQKQRPRDVSLFDSSPAQLVATYSSFSLAEKAMLKDNSHGSHGGFTIVDMSTGLVVAGRVIDQVGE